MGSYEARLKPRSSLTSFHTVEEVSYDFHKLHTVLPHRHMGTLFELDELRAAYATVNGPRTLRGGKKDNVQNDGILLWVRNCEFYSLGDLVDSDLLLHATWFALKSCLR